VQYILTLSRTAVIVRHWFEIDLADASMEHGVRIELRELAAHPPIAVMCAPGPSQSRVLCWVCVGRRRHGESLLWGHDEIRCAAAQLLRI